MFASFYYLTSSALYSVPIYSPPAIQMEVGERERCWRQSVGDQPRAAPHKVIALVAVSTYKPCVTHITANEVFHIHKPLIYLFTPSFFKLCVTFTLGCGKALEKLFPRSRMDFYHLILEGFVLVLFSSLSLSSVLCKLWFSLNESCVPQTTTVITG